MRVLIGTPYYAPAWAFGGPPELVRSLGMSLARIDGWSARVVTSTAQSPHEDVAPGHSLVDGLPVTRLARAGWPWPWSYFRMPDLRRTMRRESSAADVALLHGVWTDVDRVGARECIRSGIPYLVYTHGTFAPWALRHHWPKKVPYFPLFERAVLSGAAGIVVSHADEAIALRRRRIDVPIERIPGGVDLPSGPDPVPDPALIHSIGGRPFVLCLGRLHPQKGQDILIDAFAASLARQGFALVLAGPDSEGHGAGLIARAAARGVTDRVVFTGLVTGAEKEWLLRSAAMYAQISRSEGTSVAVLEALAHGLPTILSAAALFPELGADDASVSAALDEASVAATLERLAGARLGAGANATGAALVRERFAWPAIARRTADFIAASVGR